MQKKLTITVEEDVYDGFYRVVGRRRISRVQAVPLTSSVGRLYPSEAYVELGGERRKAMADRLTTASKQRLIRRAGVVSREDLEAVERAVRVQLGLHV